MMKIFLATGQSNSLGTCADPAEADPLPPDNKLDGLIPFFWSNRSTRAGDGTAALIGSSCGKMLTLQAQQGEGANPFFWGPEIGFGRTLAVAGIGDFLIVKASRGGGGNSFWLKGAPDDHMYRHVVDTANQAISALPKSTPFRFDALLYIQGESDNESESREAGERLLKLAANLRADLPNASDMMLIIGGIAAPGERRDEVRAQQALLPQADSSFAYIDNRDLAPSLYDNLHFDKKAKLEIGGRMAQAWLSRREKQS